MATKKTTKTTKVSANNIIEQPKDKKVKGAGGASSKLPDVLEQIPKIEELAEEGLNQEQIALELGISPASWYSYKKENLEILEAYKKGRKTYTKSLVGKCENSLAKLVEGYEYKETKTIYDSKANKEGKVTESKIVRTEVTTKYSHPNVTAIIFALQNLDPENYKDRRNIDLTGNLQVPIVLEGYESVKD